MHQRMLRILLWKISFELVNLFALLNLYRFVDPFLPRDTKIQNYFAFGANLDPEVLKNRGVRPIAEVYLGLQGWKLRFTQQGPYQGMGFGSLDEDSSSIAYGKVYQLHWIDVLRLDFFELVPIMHKHRKIKVHQQNLSMFFYQARISRENLLPTEIYLQKILKAYEQCDLVPPDHLQSLKAIECVKESIPAKDPHFVITNYDALGRKFGPLLRAYDRCSIKLFEKLYRRFPSLNAVLRKRA